MNFLDQDSDLYDEVLNLVDKYELLVWYARKPHIDLVDQTYTHLPQDMRDIVKQCIRETEKKYPQEIEELKTCRSNWEHGFNSGCLASFRFMISASRKGVDSAKELFPELDT